LPALGSRGEAGEGQLERAGSIERVDELLISLKAFSRLAMAEFNILWTFSELCGSIHESTLGQEFQWFNGWNKFSTSYFTKLSDFPHAVMQSDCR
jgi:hypothetical protein